MEKISKISVEKIENILSDIKRAKFAVPIFQRQMAWTKDKIISFYNSLLDKHPFGCIMTWTTSDFNNIDESNDIVIGFRDNQKRKEECDFIIDGQQRITSITSLYYPVEKEHLIQLESFKKFYNYVKKGIVFNLETKRFELAKKKLDKKTLYAKDIFYSFVEPSPQTLKDIIVKKCGLSPDDALSYAFDIVKIHGTIKQSIDVGIINIQNDSLEEIIQIFMDINTKGKKLTVTDIIQSYWHNLNINLNTVYNELNDIVHQKGYIEDDMSIDVLVDTIYLLLGNKPIINNKEKINVKINLPDLGNNFIDDIKDSIVKACEILYRYKIVDKTLPSEIIIKWIAYYVFKAKKMNINITEDEHLIYKYIYLISLNSVYTSSTNIKLAKDIDFVNIVLLNKETTLKNYILSNKSGLSIYSMDDEMFKDIEFRSNKMITKFIKAFILEYKNHIDIDCSEIVGEKSNINFTDINFYKEIDVDQETDFEDLTNTFGNVKLSTKKFNTRKVNNFDEIRERIISKNKNIVDLLNKTFSL